MIQRGGEPRGPQEGKTDEKDTKNSSDKLVMGYDAKFKKHGFRVSQVLLRIPSDLLNNLYQQMHTDI
jgi:hypothetical protein